MAAEARGDWAQEGLARARDLALDTWRAYQWAVAFWVVAFSVFYYFYPVPVAILFLGMVLGSLSALVAMGLVLIYRANRIINFAQSQVGGLAAVLAASLIVGPDWPFFPAVAVGFLFAIVLGAGTEYLIIRRFSKAPRLLLTVATIGIMQLFAFGQLGLPRLFDFDTVPQPPVPFDFTFNWHPAVFKGSHLLIIIIVPIVAVALSAFFRFTRVGIAVRASAESADRAALLGIPVKRLGTLVWTISAALSALGVLLRMPIQGVNIGGLEGTSLLMRALAAAVIGRMESLPKAFGAALALGMIEQSVLFETGRTVIVDGFLLAIIIGALLFQRRGEQSRADDIGMSSWAATREVRPIPRELSFLPEVKAGQVGLGLLMVVVLVIVPMRLSPNDVNLMGVGLMIAMVTLSLVILTGWAGQISLGMVAFMAFGSAVGGSLAIENWNFFLCLAAAGLVGALIAVLVGLPALRIKGLFLAVSTLAFALATGTYLLNNEFVTWLVPDPNKRIVRPVLFDRFDLDNERTYYFVILIFFSFTLASVRSLRRSRTGRILVATRDNERAAQSYAVNPIRAKLSAFALSGFFAALAGALYAFHQRGMSSTILDPDSSVRVFSMAVIGGLGSIPGALLGAVYLTFVDYSSFTKEPLSRLLASGVGVLIILMFVPGGLGSVLYSGRDALLRIIARRRNIVVPSLLADVRVVDEEANILDEEADAENVPTLQIEHLSQPKDPLLLIRDLDAGYGKTQVLFGVDMHVERGEMVALLGTNGAGKSTLLSVISGLLEPGRGTVTFDDQDISGKTPQETLAAGVVFMPGGKGVFPTLTVEENFRLAAWQFQKDQAYIDEMYRRCFDYFPVLEERWDQKAGNLSGGEQQMLTLSQALIARPKLLMIDELSLGLAPLIVEQLLGIVRSIHANGTTVVLVEQSVNVAITLADRAIFMEKGEVRFDGPTKDLLERPDILRAVFLQGADAGRGAATAVEAKPRKPFVGVCKSCGHEHTEVLSVAEIGVSFGGVRAVDGVSLAVREAEVVGIIGPNGSGKTTLFDLMSGFVMPTDGRVDLLGEDVTAWTPDMRAEAGLGRSFQDARLFPSMTVRQTIAVALERHLDIRDPFAAAVISPAVRIAERALGSEVDELIDVMHLGAFADKFVGELSTGTRRVVDIACSLAHRPKVLLLDEPSSGIAQREAEALAPLLLNIRDQTSAALIVIEHDMPLIRAISDRLVALELGQVVAQGSPDAVIHDPRVVEGYLGGTIEVIERSGATGGAARGRKAAAKTAKTKKVAAKKVASKRVASNGNGNGKSAAKKATPRKKVGV